MQGRGFGLDAREQAPHPYEPVGLGFAGGIERLLGGVETRDRLHHAIEARGRGMIARGQLGVLPVDGPGKSRRACRGGEEQPDETVPKAAPVHQSSRTPGTG